MLEPIARAKVPAIREELHTQSHFPEAAHLVKFYETDEGLVESVCGFIAEGLADGESGLVVATADHRRELDRMLQSNGLDIVSLVAAGKYICLDASETLSRILIDGSPNQNEFTKIVGALIDRMVSKGGRVRVFGEMVALLWTDGERESAVRLERLWNELQSSRPFSLLCGYPMKTLDEAPAELLAQVCGEHSAVIPGESFTAIHDEEERRSAVLLLQQKARRLEAEIELRRGVEAQLRDSDREMKDFVENAIDGLHKVGPDGKILWANRAELTMLGYSPEEYIGHHISEFHVDHELVEDILNRLARNETVVNCEAQMRRKDGTIVHVLINSNARWNNGQFAYTRCLTRDITDLKKSQAAELFLAAIIDSADDAIVSKTLDGIITSWNPAAQRIFGYEASEVVGKSISILFPEDRGDEERQILDKVKSGERVDHYETKRIRKDGRTIDVSITVSPVMSSQGVIIAASKIVRDITDRKQDENRRDELLQKEQRARAAAERANRMKDEFLATVSHELRTPLNAIIGWCHMLRGENLDPAVIARATDTIDRNARAQAQLIEDILDVSRVVTGKLQLSIGRVDLTEVINSAIDSVQPAADSKEIQIEVVADPRVRYIRGDAARLQQVVWNLLSNAVKFSSEGGKVLVRLQSHESEVQLTVTDTGAGIAPEFLPFIFERFSQADSSTTRQWGGLGLGLAIVRHLAELHGGTVLAESGGEGLGATFTVRLPRADASEADKALMRTTRLDLKAGLNTDPALLTLEGIRVLVVDDNPDTLSMLASLLSDYRADVVTAQSVSEALDLLVACRPHVLVSDVAMPNADGYTLISKIREADAGYKGLPAIALTALVRVEDRARALSAGFNMFVPKPFEPPELIAAIAHLTHAGETVSTEDKN